MTASCARCATLAPGFVCSLSCHQRALRHERALRDTELARQLADRARRELVNELAVQAKRSLASA